MPFDHTENLKYDIVIMDRNKELARMFDTLADALEFLGENPFKIRAYRKVARFLESFPEDIQKFYEEHGIEGLKSLPGVGEKIALKIEEYLKTGTFQKYEEVKSKVPDGILELLQIPGIGPKTIKKAHDELGVRNLEDLKRVIESGELARLRGMGPKKVENIKKSIELYFKMQDRIPLGEIYPFVENLRKWLAESEYVEAIEVCGSYRRKKETVGDIDILCISTHGRKVIDKFVNHPDVTRVLAHGDTKGSCIFNDRIQVDLRVVPRESFGAALQYFTGSKQHNVHLRTIAKQMGFKISEYGVFKDNVKVAGEKEEDVYGILGLDFIPPELREDRGEIEAAMEHRLPQLIERKDIKGDLHVHSKYSDGTATLEELAQKAIEMGYEYIAICDHSRSVKYAGGLTIEKLREKNREIERINEKYGKKILLKGAEVDILQDGTLDYPDEVLKELDFVVAAIHIWSKYEDVTERIIKALRNPYVHSIAHPTGRLIGKREPYNVDIERILHVAKEEEKFIEINANYERLDLNDVWSKRAKEIGVKLTIGTDAHQIGQMWMIELGVYVARRGWLEKDNVLNTLNGEKLLKMLKNRR